MRIASRLSLGAAEYLGAQGGMVNSHPTHWTRSATWTCAASVRVCIFSMALGAITNERNR